MTSAVQSETPFLDSFIQASTEYIIPIAALVANLVTYLSKDKTKPYGILGLNVLANLFFLYAYLRGPRSDRVAPNGRRSGAVSSLRLRAPRLRTREAEERQGQSSPLSSYHARGFHDDHSLVVNAARKLDPGSANPGGMAGF
ncbi:hypothetical protein FLONG3_697 [Fusarium longipes]|uniref:Uncharacterized protein n=1 Tax=Fusarium longipes TaxID=694270 RepID=A0A395T8V8_9HYPO|nr:hypothetical protein FLONG3_697 [Fusarium longipes]